jgi:hypothetical protein
MAVDAPRGGLTWLLGLSSAGWLRCPATERPAVLARGLLGAWPKRARCVRGPRPRDGGASTRGLGWRRLTFELRRPRRRAALPVRPMMTKGGCAGKAGCRSGSPLERGVRRRCAAWNTAGSTEHQALGGHWTHVKRRVRSGCLGRRLRSARACTRLQAQRRCVGGGPRTDEAPNRQGVGSPAQRLDLAVEFECGCLAQAPSDRATSSAGAWPLMSLAEARGLCSRPMAAERWSERPWPLLATPNVRAKPTAEAGRLARAAHDGPRALRGQAGPP